PLLRVAANLTEQTQLATVDIYCPRLLPGLFCQALRTCRVACLVHPSPARVHDCFAIRRQPHAHDRLPIIARVMRYLSRQEIRRVCHPDVSLALVVENPGHARRMRRARQTVGKWRTQHLFDGEAFTKTESRQQYAGQSNDKKVE